jgi:hypothetical protein
VDGGRAVPETREKDLGPVGGQLREQRDGPVVGQPAESFAVGVDDADFFFARGVVDENDPARRRPGLAREITHDLVGPQVGGPPRALAERVALRHHGAAGVGFVQGGR